ncbi:hypothetical protein CK203_060226 [Vitis vinifera]|uniref:Uncharacterized protein n=1 Tax=Vitis vinifera TaxID=29760 RepID=A0A438FS49_VITVI|nr:hypothetical protein CK203_060226 [Vitis vinifera]
MKDRREAKGNKARKRRKKVISKFERELKKLECSMNYLGVIGSGNRSGRGGELNFGDAGNGRSKKEDFWGELGAIKGLWADPCSGLNNLAFSRLDPFLVFDTWESHFSGVIQCILPKPVSDHSPILLDGVAVRTRPIPLDLKRWNKDVFGNVSFKKDVAFNEIGFWDAKEREGFLTTEEADAKRQALGDYRLKIDREFFEHIGLKEGIVRAYSSILFEPPYWRPSINTLDFKVLDVAEVVGLESCLQMRSEFGEKQANSYCSVDQVEELISVCGCKVSTLPSTYLRLPLGAPFRSVAVWDWVEERKFKGFPWGGEGLVKKIYLVKRSTMCLEESKGGLAIQRLSLLNKVFLYKWIWRFATKRCAFWTQVIKGKYGEEECGWWSGEVRDGYRVGLWKSITKEQSTFLGHFSFMVGNGRR